MCLKRDVYPSKLDVYPSKYQPSIHAFIQHISTDSTILCPKDKVVNKRDKMSKT